jgi:hypothetical protein
VEPQAAPLPARKIRPPAPASATPAADAGLWWDDPITVGALLVVMPPVGLAALWASRCFSREARLAITGMMALMLSLAAAVMTALALR